MTPQEIHDEVFHIVHSADGDTDDLIDELAAWALDLSQRSHRRGCQRA